MRVMITGAGGYIGSVTAYGLLKVGHHVIAVDNFFRGYRDPLILLSGLFPNQVDIIEHDLRKPIPSGLIAPQIDSVLHCAALCIVDESVKNPDLYLKDNPLMLKNVLDLMKEKSIRHIVLSSTAAVYGQPENIPVDESAPMKPINPYGESKVLSEELLMGMASKLGITYIIFRYFNVCGASDDGVIGDSKKPSELLVQNAVRGALRIEPFILTCGYVDTPDGSPIRDFINVADLASAHSLALEYLSSGGMSEVCNLGTETGMSVLEVVKAVENQTNTLIPLNRTTPRLGEQANVIASSRKAHELLGWSSKRSLDDSVRSLISWYSKYPNGWKN